MGHNKQPTPRPIIIIVGAPCVDRPISFDQGPPRPT